MARYTIRENEDFICKNIAKYETSESVRNEFNSRKIWVDINKPTTIKFVEKYYKYYDFSSRTETAMKLGINFEKTYHVYTDGLINMTVTSMNDGSLGRAHIIHGNMHKTVKIS